MGVKSATSNWAVLFGEVCMLVHLFIGLLRLERRLLLGLVVEECSNLVFSLFAFYSSAALADGQLLSNPRQALRIAVFR